MLMQVNKINEYVNWVYYTPVGYAEVKLRENILKYRNILGII